MFADLPRQIAARREEAPRGSGLDLGFVFPQGLRATFDRAWDRARSSAAGISPSAPDSPRTTGIPRSCTGILTMSARRHLGLLFALGFLAGCATHVQVIPNSPSSASPGKHESFQVARQPWWRGDPLQSELLRRHKLQKLIRKNPDLALQKLNEAVAINSKIDEVAAAAGSTLRYGHELERTQPEKAVSLYLTAAVRAYQAFTCGAETSSTNPPNSRIVQEYNHATLRVVMLLQNMPGGMRTNHVLLVSGKAVRVEAQAGDTDSDPCCYDQWFAADHWKQRGLTHSYRLDGLGARLVAFHTNRQATALELRQPDEGIFHASTAILRFQSGESESAVQTQSVKLVFYNPTLTPEIAVNGQSWPLAADFTMPGAMLLSRTRPLFKTRWTALVHPGETPRQHRLYLMQPYSPDRIPIIMVHGLRSTPLAWQELTNELMGDPILGRRYQMWHYLYPTGLPFLTSAADFRDELEAVREIVDPAGHDFAAQHMVVIGHSMGGLLARTLVTDGGDAIWDSTSAIPVSDLDSDLAQLPEF